MVTSYRTGFTLAVVAFTLTEIVLGQKQGFGSGDISSYLGDPNFVQRQIKCVLGESGCDNIGNQLKLAIPEVIARNCRSCNPQQAANARKLISFLQQRYPAQWQRIQARFSG